MWGLVDPGANWSIVSREVLRQDGAQYSDRRRPVSSVEGVGGGETEVVGLVELYLGLGDLRKVVQLIVVEKGLDLLVGSDVLSTLGVMRAIEEKLKASGVRYETASSAPAAAAAEAAWAARESGSTSDPYESEAAIRAYDLRHLPERQAARLRNVLLRHRKAFLREGALPPPLEGGANEDRDRGQGQRGDEATADERRDRGGVRAASQAHGEVGHRGARAGGTQGGLPCRGLAGA